jgi:general secretion pathway protein I
MTLGTLGTYNPGPDLAYNLNMLIRACNILRLSNLIREHSARAGFRHFRSGFTLLEVMIAIAIIAITLLAVFGSQSQSLSLANEAKFSTTAALLAQSKMAEIEAVNPEDLASDSGDFGENFPNYHWKLTVSDVSFAGIDEVLDYLKKIDLSLFYGEHGQYKYSLRLYRFVPKTKS